jgi:hypothetical protein
MKEKPTVGSPFFGVFPSDHIPKTMKNVSVHLFTVAIPVSYISEFWELSEATSIHLDIGSKS